MFLKSYLFTEFQIAIFNYVYNLNFKWNSALIFNFGLLYFAIEHSIEIVDLLLKIPEIDVNEKGILILFLNYVNIIF